MFRRGVVGVVVFVLGLVLVGVVPVLARADGGAWWRLLSGARPSYLRVLPDKAPPVAGADEVQEIVVTEGEGFGGKMGNYFALEVGGGFVGEFVTGEFTELGFAPAATAASLQAALEVEGIYGNGDVEVTESSPLPGVLSFVVTSVGGDAERPVPAIDVIEGVGPAEGKVLTAGRLPVATPDGVLVASAVNIGETSTNGEPVELTDKLPAGLEAVSVETAMGNGSQKSSPPCSRERGEEVQCTATVVPPYDTLELRISVLVKGVVPARGVSESEVNEFSVSGGGAPAVTIRRPVKLSEEPVPLGLQDYELTPEEVGGGPDTQAGSHPFQTTFTFETNQVAESRSAAGFVNGNTAELPRDVDDYLPPGMIGNPEPFQRCTNAQFLASVNECPAGSIVGVVDTTVTEPGHLGVLTFPTPLYNLEPAVGEPAKFGFIVVSNENPVYINTSVRTGSDYGVTAEVRDIPQTVGFLSSVVTVWGVPGNTAHNETRGGCLIAAERSILPPCEPAFSESSPPPFFELPTSCPVTASGEPEPMRSSVAVDSWEHPAPADGPFPAAITTSEPLPALDGCNRLPFAPTLEVKPDVPDASTSTGLTVNLKVPQQESLNANGLGEADVRDTTVTLPEGIAVNPSDGDGLQACSNALIGFEGEGEPELEPGVTVPQFTPVLPGGVNSSERLEPGLNFCSNASKIAAVRVKLPVLKHDLEGAVYLAPQEANPFGSLVAMYIVAEDPESGVLLKLPGEVKLTQTGQIVTTFLNTPQGPAEEIELHFFGGERAPLATPAYCGLYTTTSSITPWSAPQSGPPATPASSFKITSGPNGSQCPGPGLPFDPSLTAGTTSIQAGGFSPFTTTMNREDGNQHLQAIELKMPAGITGLLAGVELCPEPQADEGLCGPNSMIGETTVSVGVGGDPFSVKGGKVYITGPFNGSGGCTVGTPGCAPFGLSIVNPAKAGPYDLADTKTNHPPCDCVLVRAKIEVNPITAALTVTSPTSGPYQIPTILEGIPLQIKHVNVTVTHPNFTLNPTSCEPLEIIGDLSSSEGATQTLHVPFQATNCATLKFNPEIAVSTPAHASKENGASLHFKIAYPHNAIGSQAWFNEAKFDLPKQLPARLETLQRACLSTVFETNRTACPKASIIGSAIVHTQVLPVPLTGPVYFVSYGGQKFPEAVLVLEGYGVTVDLHGETFINNKTGITSATFRNTPDVPFESIEVTIPTGRYSEFAANLPAKDHYDFCGQKLQMPTLFKAQNGQEIHQTTPITVTGCTLQINSHTIKGHTITLTITVPAAGTLKATGTHLASVTKHTHGPETITITLHQTKPTKHTTIKLTFTPTNNPKHTTTLTTTLKQ